jgi:hypothetical protein
MPLVNPSDLGTTRRERLSPRVRLAIWERARGNCVLCERRINGVRERWIIEHIWALELGGLDEPDNMGPAHETCGRTKPREDHRRAAKAKRQKLRHLGADQAKRPLPRGRRSRWKKRSTALSCRESKSPPRSGTCTLPIQLVQPQFRQRLRSNSGWEGLSLPPVEEDSVSGEIANGEPTG